MPTLPREGLAIMGHLRIPFAVLFILTLLTACSDSTKPDTTPGDIRGVVVDAQGHPVAGATVVLQHAIDPPIVSQRDKIQTVVRFDLPVTGPVSMWLSSFCDDDTVRMLIDGELPAGQHSVVWDGLDDLGRVLSDGVYWSHVVTVNGETRHAALMLRLGYGDLTTQEELAPLALTDEHGHFALSQECLPFGHTFMGTDELGNETVTITVTREVRIWAVDPATGVPTGSSWLTVDAANGADLTVTLGARLRR